MTVFKAACVQMRSGCDPVVNWANCEALVREAASQGAHYVQTPEMSNILARSKADQIAACFDQDKDPFLAKARALAKELKIWLHLGSIAVRGEGEKLANRGFLIGPDGEIAASYDKIHMFDVDLPNGESWRESETYQPGSVSPVVETELGAFGLAICYDVRQPALFRQQSRAGAQVITAPAAFTRQTGQAHWHVLQRSRAIENGAYMISAAQGGRHEDGRETYGHSIVVDPWGKVIAELDHDEPGVLLAQIDSEAVKAARSRIPAIVNEREFQVKTVAATSAVETGI
ncbi:carbon-nitrogen hydrolase family protein [Rhodobacteraceae bacterium RKSG542]|uniref:carbon-nitrogen hydrolase family protein n=1 Tax=Pseudovibrio flavus TaxID=2529854 RepID=UPI0012BC4C3F|nr:carbon-nitrogen hydrolase family protein [Pseudovibrio flavus]MTI18260.1 carbon-nitrogen hydrolase family protein [Pseudovibrio flavus]